MTEGKTPQTFSDFLRDLEAGRVAPAYFFFGPEEVLVARALQRLKEVALEPGTSDFNWDVFRADADDMNWAAFSDALTSLPLMASKRIVILKHVGKAQQNKTVVGLIERAVQKPNADLTLVLIEPEPDLKKSFFKRLLDHCTGVAFPFAKPVELQHYLKEHAASFGKTIADGALERILAESAPGMRDILSKLEVLILFVEDKRVIDAQDVEGCTAFSREVEIFQLLDALGRRDAPATHSILEQLLRRRADLGALIYLLCRQFWALYRMKYLQEKKVPVSEWLTQLDLKPPFLEKRYRQYLPHFSRRELGRSLEVLVQADQTRKSSAASEAQLCWMLVESLLHPVSLNAN